MGIVTNDYQSDVGRIKSMLIKHDDPGQGLFGAAPVGGQTPPQHSDDRKWVRLGVQKQTFSSE